MRAVNFPKSAYRLERRLGRGAPRLNQAPRSPHQRTAPARDFAQQSWKGLEGRRGLGWNPSKKGLGWEPQYRRVWGGTPIIKKTPGFLP